MYYVLASAPSFFFSSPSSSSGPPSSSSPDPCFSSAVPCSSSYFIIIPLPVGWLQGIQTFLINATSTLGRLHGGGSGRPPHCGWNSVTNSSKGRKIWPTNPFESPSLHFKMLPVCIRNAVASLYTFPSSATPPSLPRPSWGVLTNDSQDHSHTLERRVTGCTLPPFEASASQGSLKDFSFTSPNNCFSLLVYEMASL